MNNKRKEELQKEIERLQKKLEQIDKTGPDSEEEEFISKEFMKDFDPFGKKGGMHSYSFSTEKKLSPEEKKRIKDEIKNIRKEKAKINKNIQKMREKMREQQEELRKIQFELREEQRELREKERKLREKRYPRWDLDLDEDLDVMSTDLEMRLSDYTRSILSSVAESLKSSMGAATKGAKEAGKEIKIVSKELGKIGKEIGEKISKDLYVAIGPQIPEEQLEEFYEVGATIVSAIGDPNRLRILKELEKGPKYQKELSEITNLRGGTFKHHMDRLLDDTTKFVTQEVVRGRYLLTTRGREALKLAEMQYLRYLEEKKGLNSDEYEVDIR